jgi:hypothetical protein
VALSTTIASSSTAGAGPSSLDASDSGRVAETSNPGTGTSALADKAAEASSDHSLTSGLMLNRIPSPRRRHRLCWGMALATSPPSPMHGGTSLVHRGPPSSCGSMSFFFCCCSVANRHVVRPAASSRKSEGKCETYQGHVTMLKAHQNGDGAIRLPHCPLHLTRGARRWRG